MFTTWQVICMLTKAFVYGIVGSLGIAGVWYLIRPRWTEGAIMPLNVQVDAPRAPEADFPLVNIQDPHS